mgnify:CR=1 FL=1
MPEVAVPAKQEPRASTIVLTGETRAAFMDRRLDIAKPEPAPAAAEPAKVEPAKAEPAAPAAKSEPVAEPDAELEAVIAEAQTSNQKAEKKQAFRERMSELTEAKKAAEAAREAEKARADKAEAELRAKATPPPAPEELQAPHRAAFATEDEYQDARVDYRVKLARENDRKEEAASRAKAEGERVVSTYAERLRATKADVKDYDARIEPMKDLLIPPYIRDSILESEVGPMLPLYFADHPAEARRIIGLPTTAALRELGKIEAMFETAHKSEAKAEAKPVAQVSKAPPPISPIKATNAGEDAPKVDAGGNFTGTYAEYKELRKAGKIR